MVVSFLCALARAVTNKLNNVQSDNSPVTADSGRNRSGTKQICVIGAGPSGLAALKVIKDTQQYKDGLWEPIAFEAREDIGGVWLPAPPTDDPPLTSVYDSLTAAVPHFVMAYPSLPFPPSTPVFPHASVIQKYLISYVEHFNLMPHIRLNTSVESVEHKAGKWEVKVSTGESFRFDLVLVCNGYFRVPLYPETAGIEDWLKEGKATHSAWYRKPHNLGGKVLVVGGGPSGSDISVEMASVSQTVIHSLTGGPNEDKGNLKVRGRVSRFEENGRVTFEDGIFEEEIDHCILATGYQTSFPFLESVLQRGIPSFAPPLSSQLYDTSYSVYPLAKHIFPLHHPSLAFLRLSLKTIPFPLVEAQTRAILHVFLHPEAFDPTQEALDITTRYERLRAQIGDDPHVMAKMYDRMRLEQFDYRDQLSQFSAQTFEVVKVEDWERVALVNTYVLKKVWKELEKTGEADEWVKGVGENGNHEWVSLLERMLDRAKNMGLTVLDIHQTRF